MHKFTVVALLAVVASSSVHALSGGELLDACRQIEKVKADGTSPDVDAMVAANICTAYMTGIAEGMTLADQGNGDKFCLPEGLKWQQFPRVMVEYLEERPKRHHEFSAPLVGEALTRAFPCH